MTDYQPLNYRLRCHTKRRDLPPDVLRDICEAYVKLLKLEEDVVHLAHELNEIKEGFEGCCNACEPVGSMNKKLREERDEARRDVCSMMHMTGFLGGDYAHSKGWDCFKDVHTGFSPEIQNFRDIFYGYKDKLRAERDEARRIVCGLIYDQASSPNTTKQSIAEAEGWDCYKEKHDA
jgi:hypothetical protein